MAHHKKNKINRISIVIVVASFAVLGVILLVGSRAATNYISGETESGTLSGGATTITDSNASGGSAVRFGTPPSSTTCPSPTPTAPVTGYSIVKCEDFESSLGPFLPYTGTNNTVVGKGRLPSQCSVSGGALILKQAADGATCGGWMSGFGQRYGYWEVKMRTYYTSTATGSAPHPVLILWPSTGGWTSELDYFETDLGGEAGVFLHCTDPNGNANRNCFIRHDPVDYTQYHVYGILWEPGRMTGYIDDRQWWTSTSISSFEPLGSSNQTIQLDNLSGNTPVRPGQMDIDWVHMYKKN